MIFNKRNTKFSRLVALVLIELIVFSGTIVPARALTARVRREASANSAKRESARNSTLVPQGPTPSITATNVDAWDDSATPDGKAEPGQTISYTVTINNTGADANNVVLTDALDPQTTFLSSSVSPIATNDAYDVLGNVRIDTATIGANCTANSLRSVLCNDNLTNGGSLFKYGATPASITSNPTAGGTNSITTSKGGTISLRTDGSFVYNPPTGFKGTGANSDEFWYSVISGSSQNTARVALNVSGIIWFINNTTAACSSACDGRLTNPFKSFSSFSNSNTGMPGQPRNGDNIFLYTGSNLYTGGLILRNGQRLIGQAATSTLAQITGLTAPPGSNALPSTGGLQPHLNAGTLVVGKDNSIYGISISNTSNAKILGGPIGTLTIRDTSLLGTGGALDLSSGTLDAVFSSIVSTSSFGSGLVLNEVAGTLKSTSTTISNPPGGGININSCTANLDFGDTDVTGANGGINAQSSIGNISFGHLNLSPAPGNSALSIVNHVGTISSSSGTLTSTLNNVIFILGTDAAAPTNLALNLTSINSADSPNYGVWIQNATGNLTVSGTVVPGSGGEIQRTALAGMKLSNVAGLDLRFMSIHDTADSGLQGTDINGLNLHAVNIYNFGNESPATGSEDAVNLTNMSGPLIIQHSTFGPDGHFVPSANPPAPANNGIVIKNDSVADLDMTMTGSTFKQISNNGLDIEISNGSGSVNLDGRTLDGRNAFDSLNGTAILFGSPSDSSMNQVLQLTASNDTFSNLPNAVRWLSAGNTTLFAQFKDNTLNSITGNAVQSIATPFVAGSMSELTATVSGNDMGGGGILIDSERGATQTMTFGGIDPAAGNTGIGRSGVLATASRGSSLNLDFLNNTVAVNSGSPDLATALHVQVINAGGGNSFVCANIAGNTLTETPSTGKPAIFLDTTSGGGGTIGIEGWNGTGGIPGLASFLSATNTLTASQSVQQDSPLVFAGSDCVQSSALIREAPLQVPSTITRTSLARSSRANHGKPSSDEFRHSGATQFGDRSHVRQNADNIIRMARGTSNIPNIAPEPFNVVRNTLSSLALSLQPLPSPTPVTITIGTIPSGEQVVVTIKVQVNNPYLSTISHVSNQGTISGSNFANVLTDDPDSPGSSDPTTTPIHTAPSVSVHDARLAEPASGSAPMYFTVSLSEPATQTTLVGYRTSDLPAGTGHAIAGLDYVSVGGDTVVFQPGEQVKTIPIQILSGSNAAEPDETFLLKLTTTSKGNISNDTGTGTITSSSSPGQVVISEFRLSGPGGASDQFIELYNNTDNSKDISGWSLIATSGGCSATPSVIATIPASTSIPARGHYLIVNSNGYSLGFYPAGNAGTTGEFASGDLTFAANIPVDSNIALFTTSDITQLSSTNMIDAVGFSNGDMCGLLSEGTPLAPLGSAGSPASEYSLIRKLDTGIATDSNNNSSDFIVLSTTPETNVGTLVPMLGAPGPENLASPVIRTGSNQLSPSMLDACIGPNTAPNRVRDTTGFSDTLSETGLYSLGTLAIRRTYTNTSQTPVTRLRFRIADITGAVGTGNAGPGLADLRAISSGDNQVTISAACGGSVVTVKGLLLELPPVQSRGGGFNSTLTAGSVTLAKPLAPGDSINVQWKLGVKQIGSFRFFVIVEGLP